MASLDLHGYLYKMLGEHLQNLFMNTSIKVLSMLL